MNRARREAGFTLLEVLVALTVLGFLLLGLAQGFRFGLLAWDRQARITGGGGELDAVDRLLRRMVEQLAPGTARDPALLVGTARGLAAQTDLGPAAGALGVRDADITLALDGGRLVLRWRPHAYGTRFATLPPPAEVELLRGVAGIEISYWGGVPAAWRQEWREPVLPALVRLQLRFEAGDPRRWPDIVAAPRRERPDT